MKLGNNSLFEEGEKEKEGQEGKKKEKLEKEEKMKGKGKFKPTYNIFHKCLKLLSDTITKQNTQKTRKRSI